VTNAQLYWLLARLLVTIRRGYITTHIAPLYDELKTVLTTASGVQIDSTTPGDDELLDLFRLKAEADKPNEWIWEKVDPEAVKRVVDYAESMPPDEPTEKPKKAKRA
jgi:hypothetical protein